MFSILSFIIKNWRWILALSLAVIIGGAVGYIRHKLAENEVLKIEAQAREDYIEDLIHQQDAMIKSQKTKVKNEQMVKGKSHSELVSILAGEQWLRND